MSRFYANRLLSAFAALAITLAPAAALAQASTMAPTATMKPVKTTKTKSKTTTTSPSGATTTTATTTTSTGGLQKFATTAAAQTSCPGDTVVWSTMSKTKTFHASTSKYFGKTKHGAYICQQAATAAGYHLSKT